MAELAELTPQTVNRLIAAERLDIEIIERLRPFLKTPAARWLGKLGKLGDDRLLLVLSAGIVATGVATRNGKLQRTGARMFLAQVTAKGLKQWGKDKVDRSRPSVQIEEGRYVAEAGNSQAHELRSFPSGHAAAALATARAFSREYPTYTKPILMAAAAVGALQIPRRANYPGDVAAGAGAGMIAEKIADGIVAMVARLRHRPKRRARSQSQNQSNSL